MMWTYIKASLLQIIVFCTTVLIIKSSPVSYRSTSLKLERDSRQQNNRGKDPRTHTIPSEWNPEYFFGRHSRRSRRQALAPNRLRSLSPVPTYKAIGWLVNKRGLAVEINGTKVRGVPRCNHSGPDYTLLEVSSHNASIRRIKGIVSGRYLAVNTLGDMITESVTTNASFFIEHLEENVFLTYQSMIKVQEDAQKNRGTGGRVDNWFLAIKANGKVSRGKNTDPGMKSAHFKFVRFNKTQLWPKCTT